MATNILQEILTVKLQEIEAAKAAKPLLALHRDAEAAPLPRNFIEALHDKISAGSAAVIAEIKKASPSKGLIRPDFDPPALARANQCWAAAGSAPASADPTAPVIGVLALQGDVREHLRSLTACRMSVSRGWLAR